MSEGVQIEVNSLMRWITIICGAMLFVAILFGFVPLFVSHRKIMDA
jgi:hypothetical protein